MHSTQVLRLQLVSPSYSVYLVAVLTELQIKQFRNLNFAQFEPSPQFNFIYGENASGKTSMLEAIYMLSLNRSFRTNNLQYLIQHGADDCSVFSRLSCLGFPYGNDAKLGVSRNRSKQCTFRINGTSVTKASELAQLLPVTAIEPASFELIDGSPSHRRAVLDWLVFHVKHDFLTHSRNYQRVLKQRNSLLRSGKIDRLMLNQWDTLLIESALKIEAFRAPVLKDIREALNTTLANTPLLAGLDIELEYKSGWGSEHKPEESDVEWYKQQLMRSFEADLNRGSTQIGSHRHDIKIKTRSAKASEFLSRGQKKTVILAIYLCLAGLLKKQSGQSPVFLLDDLPSELDAQHLSWLCEQLDTMNAQVFISSVETEALTRLPLFEVNKAKYKMFHVKQGVVETVLE